MPCLTLTLRGIKKVYAKPVKPRIPITSEYMLKLHTVVSHGFVDAYTDSMLLEALCLGLLGVLHCGEFTTISSTFDPHNKLSLSNITMWFNSTLHKHYFTLQLSSSKTDPFNHGCEVFFGLPLYITSAWSLPCGYTCLDHR